VDKYPFYHIYHGPRKTGRKHNDMNAAKQGGNGGGWGMNTAHLFVARWPVPAGIRK
jgi:hypothetical protein